MISQVECLTEEAVVVGCSDALFEEAVLVGIVAWRLWQPYEESFPVGTSNEFLSVTVVASLQGQQDHATQQHVTY